MLDLGDVVFVPPGYFRGHAHAPGLDPVGGESLLQRRRSIRAPEHAPGDQPDLVAGAKEVLLVQPGPQVGGVAGALPAGETLADVRCLHGRGS